MGTDNQSETRPKLTLGLKKKTGDNQSQPTEGRSRLTLGLRNDVGTTQSTHQPPPKFDYALNTKRAAVLQELSSDIDKKRSTIKMSYTTGRLEIGIKINALPNWVETIKHDWKRFCVNAEGQVVQMTVRPGVWNKLVRANEEYPMWMAFITGKMGIRIRDGFILLEPSIQIHEIVPKKPKEE
jgi:hypothetical protein